MIYISVADIIDDAIPEKYKYKNRFIKSIIYFFRNKFSIILEKNIDNKKLYILPNLNNKYINKINKLIKVKCINTVVLSEKLMNNYNFITKIKENDIKILDGRWIYKYLREKLLEYVVEEKNEKLYNQEVSILVNKIDEIIVDNIKNIAKKVKLLNLITTNEGALRNIEKSIYEKEGIILNITNNYKKSLIKSDIIFNIDFPVEEFNNYTLPRKACIINTEKDVKIYSKIFEGINILDFEITLPKRFIKQINCLKEFKPTIIYESFIYKRTSLKNIKREIEEDKIRILSLYGQNGKIRKSELKNLSKNINKM